MKEKALWQALKRHLPNAIRIEAKIPRGLPDVYDPVSGEWIELKVARFTRKGMVSGLRPEQAIVGSRVNGWVLVDLGKPLPLFEGLFHRYLLSKHHTQLLKPIDPMKCSGFFCVDLKAVVELLGEKEDA